MAAPRRRCAAGFTLVEVLVALALMAVLAGLAWRGIGGVAGARQASEQRVEQTLRLGTVIAQWEQDLQAVQDSALVPALTFDGATLRLVRRRPEGLQVVAWSLRGGNWLRWNGPVAAESRGLQDAWMASQQLLGNEPGQQVLLEGVEAWQVYFYRGNAWSNAQSSADLAPAPGVGASGPAAPVRALLPSGVRLVLTLQPAREGGMSGVLTRDVMMPPAWP
ncbi:MAG TPA: type II secretion system protein GspJ [Burkholderiaceae bacterium]|nr:type II secretion system protein GspJ [Burkholderiaceae bacterium]